MVNTAPVEQIKYDNKIEENHLADYLENLKRKEESEEVDDKSNLIAQIYSNKFGLMMQTKKKKLQKKLQLMIYQ